MHAPTIAACAIILDAYVDMNLGQGHILGWYFPPVLYLLSLASFVLSVLALLSCGLSSAVARRNYDLIKVLFLFPFYIFIFYIAAWRGCFQLFTRPYYWEKTKHGLG